jgi:hypothetical protein
MKRKYAVPHHRSWGFDITTPTQIQLDIFDQLDRLEDPKTQEAGSDEEGDAKGNDGSNLE